MEKSVQKELFQILVKAYYDNNFENTLKTILTTWPYPKSELLNTISTLCGVYISFDDENFIENLKNAIMQYESNHKVVSKIDICNDCHSNNNEKDCEKTCPFDAISTDPSTGSTIINNDACLDCGLCVDACKNGKIMDRIEFIPLLDILKKNSTVIAAVAPAICGQFGEDVSLDQLRTAFKKLGFSDMVEVAFFADMLTIKEAFEFNKLVSNKEDLMITSCCCPVWIAMLKKVYKDLIKYVSPSVSPMIAAGRVLKKLNPDCSVVFIGPCIAKKAEIKEHDLVGAIDYVLTFEELKDIFEALDVVPSEMPPTPTIEYASKGGRLYGRTAGVSTAINDTIKYMFPEKHPMLKAAQAHGVKECRAMLKQVEEKTIDANFIEGMGCVGGCVGGPKRIISIEAGTHLLNEFCDKSQFSVPIESDCMNNILKKIGINSIEDFESEDKAEIFERNL